MSAPTVADEADRHWHKTVDLLVIGAGAAGMTAALVGAIEGLDAVICEKSGMVGGLTATSAGTAWVPATRQGNRAGAPDTIEAARRYLDSVVGSPQGAEQREAFLRSGAEVIDYLEENTDVAFAAPATHPDYLGNRPGAVRGGRALAALPFDGRLLGRDFARVRPPRPEFLVLGGMMVGKSDIPALLKPFRSAGAFFHVAGLLLRHLTDRLRYRRGTRLVMGNALVARLLMSLKRQDVPILFETRLVDLVRDGGAVIGAIVEGPDGKQHVRARHGVVLAAGGIGWNAGLRAALFPPTAQQLSLAPTENAGEGIAAGRRLGGALDDKVASAGLWMPCSILKRPDGATSVYPHIVLDRAKPGLIAVNGAGRRFVNEADSYHDFCLGMLRSHQDVPSVPSYLLCDRRFIADYGIGLIHPGTRKLRRFIEAGYLIEAPTLQALAKRIHVDAAVLEQTVARHNRHALTGNDEDFGRGSSDLNQVNGDPANRPNPCLREIGPGPYYGVAVYPADLGSSAGLRTDSDGRVLSQDEAPIAGLYACGNDAVSIFRGAYPGPGATLGPALVFAWRAAMHAAKSR